MSFDKLHEYLTAIYTDECCTSPLSLERGAGGELAAGDSFKNALEAIKKAFDEAIIFIHGKKKFNAYLLKEKPVRGLINEINGVLQKAVAKGIGYKVPEVMKQHLQKDVFTFSGMKTYAEMKEASGLLMDEKGGIKPLSKFTEDVKKIHATYNENYLRAERNFAVGSAQNASKWPKYDSEKERYDLKYMTDNGPNVRETHRALEGTVLQVDDPFWNSYAPKNGWNCHCFLLQVRKGEYPVSDSAEAIKKGDAATTQIGKDGKNKGEIFRFNPGKEMKVFPPGHPLLNPKCSPGKLAAGECDGKKALEEVKKMAELQSVRETRDSAKEWAKENILPHKSLIIQTSAKHIDELTVSRANIKSMVSKGHDHAPERNEAVKDLKTLFDKSKYAGWANDEIIDGVQKHPDVKYWQYYEVKIAGEKSYVCVKYTADGLYKPHSIEQESEFLKIKGIKNESPKKEANR